MELIAPETSGMRELLAIRAAVRASTEMDRPPGSPAALIQVAPDGPEIGTLHALSSGLTVLGRGPGPGVRLSVEDISVSRIHARLRLLPSGVLGVTDAGSMNGTFINETRISAGEAYEGDFIRFGQCAFRFLGPTPRAG